MGIHCCGLLTDIIQWKSLQNQVPYIICSCCIGKIKNSSSFITFPRSKLFRSILTKKEYFDLASFGDIENWNLNSNYSKKRLLSKLYIEFDRNQIAEEEYHYQTFIIQMKPKECTPKFDIIFGIPANWKNFKIEN